MTGPRRCSPGSWACFESSVSGWTFQMRCAGDGRTDNLGYVSPKSARAVSLEAGAPYREKLLPLPRFLIGEQGRPVANHPGADLADAAELTGYFLERHVFAQRDGGFRAHVADL